MPDREQRDPVPILLRHLADAEAAVAFHRVSHRRGNVEALVAGLKVGWLRALLREIAPERPR